MRCPPLLHFGGKLWNVIKGRSRRCCGAESSNSVRNAFLVGSEAYWYMLTCQESPDQVHTLAKHRRCCYPDQQRKFRLERGMCRLEIERGQAQEQCARPSEQQLEDLRKEKWINDIGSIYMCTYRLCTQRVELVQRAFFQQLFRIR